MESAINSWDETHMMELRDRLQDHKIDANGTSLPPAANNPEDWVTARSIIATSGDLARNAQSLAEELVALRREHTKLQQAIFEAAQIQRTLCAPRELVWGEFEIAGEIFPVRHLSGDFFKVLVLPNVIAIALGDIAGKGFSAGIWQAHQMALIQRAARTHSDPAAVVAEVNHELCQDSGGPPLTALFYATIDMQTNELRYCNAGLPAPALLRANGTLEHLREGGPILGALKNADFQTASITLGPGDMLFAYSDGVTECRNAADDEFETKRLIAAAKAVFGASASRALFSLLGTVLDFADSRSQGDDVTLLVLRRRAAIPGDQPRSREKDYSAPNRSVSVLMPRDTNRGGHSFR
jgi:serine phosphatase RsbU (regulator of sigma subunit)